MATYIPQQGDRIVSGASPATEDLSRVGGFVAGCGQAALAVILNLTHGEGTSPQQVSSLIQQSVAAHQTVGPYAQSGQSTPQNLEWLASQHGTSLQSISLDQVDQHAGHTPVIVGVNNAEAFGGSDSNVQGHYITIVGRTAQGDYIVSDPNTPESQNGQFVTYSAAQIAASDPFWVAVPTTQLLDSSTTTTNGGGNGSSSGCVHQISLFPGATVCLDAGLELLIRGGLILAGVVLVLAAIMVFAAGNSGVRSAVGDLGEGAAHAAVAA